MQKYLTIFSTTIKEYFVYRLNFVLWRFRVILNILLPLFLWSAVFDQNSLIGNYDKSLFISYLVYGNLVASFVFGTRTFEISNDINDGKIINILLKPVSFFSYYFTREIADKTINLLFAIFEISFLIWFFKLPINPPSSLPLFFIIFLNGILISYFINLSLSFFGFWTTEVWPIRFIFTIVLFFIAGNYFPLDILPKPIYNLILVTPFPYMFYLPTKILIKDGTLNQNQFGSGQTIQQMIFLSYLWLFLSYSLARLIWKSGIRSFSFWGR